MAIMGTGCVLYSVFPKDSSVIARVNGYDIDVDAFQKRISNIHKYKPMVRPEGGVKGIDIQNIVQDMINDRLIIQEAYKVRLAESPSFQRLVDRYIASRSVLRLRKEEVQDKINVTEEALREYFNTYYKDIKIRPPEEMFEKVKNRIKKKLFKSEEAKRSNDYIAVLKSKASIFIDTDILCSLDPSAKDCDTNTVIARINERPINACDYMAEASRQLSRKRKSPQEAEHRKTFNQEILDSLITYELVEQEALKRNYMDDPLFKKDVDAYKDNLLINLFKQEIILPRAIPNEEELEEYYEIHKDEFKKDDEVWFSEMTFSTPDAAEAVLKELKEGADFEFLASKESLSKARTGVHVWTPLGHLSPEMRKGIRDLDVGALSDIIKDSRQYRIVKLKGKREGKPEAFSRIIDKVRQVVVKRKFNQWLQKYLEELRNVSSINIHKKLLNKLTERYTEGT